MAEFWRNKILPTKQRVEILSESVCWASVYSLYLCALARKVQGIVQ